MFFRTVVCSLLLLLSISVVSAQRQEATAVSIAGPEWRGVNRFAIGSLTAAAFTGPSVPAGKREIISKGFDRFGLDGLSNGLATSFGGDVATGSPFSGQMPPPLLSFDGINNIDNGLAYNLLFIPPDMVGAVGPEHFVQVVNALIRVYDKAGNPQTPPVRINSLFAPLQTICANRFDGLPNIIYDQFADRWLISQVCSAFPPFRQMIAVSRTGDPAGEYYLYEFVMPNVKINDFPKFGLWPSAYTMTTDEFLGSDYVGAGMFAFERAKLLAGDASARYIYFNSPVPVQPRRRGMLPADIDGLKLPPENSPGIFASYTATEYGDTADSIRLFAFAPNFAEPANSTFSELPESPILLEPFDPTSPDGRTDIAQPPPGEFLDSQSDRLNNRLAYRNLGTHESLVVAKTVRMTPTEQTYRAGVRVTELRRASAGFSPAVQATIGDGSSSRWISSAALDHEGNLAVQYNFVSDEKKPSILYSGRLTTDPPDTLREEGQLVEGTGVQRTFGFRWGDYASITPDPVDDCTFWFTGEYYTQASQDQSELGWLTRIGAFKFDECIAAPRAAISGGVTDNSTGLPIANARVKAGDYSRTSNAAGSYGSLTVLPGSYELRAEASGYRAETGQITLSSGQVEPRNFSLEPLAEFQIETAELINDSCPTSSVPRPGDSVTLRLTLKNTGARDSLPLTATVVADDIVIQPGPPQELGVVPLNAAVTADFTFAILSGAKCGVAISPTITLSEGTEPLGELSVPLRAGGERVAFSESFDGVTAPQLPAGWTTSTTENHQLWRTSSARNESAPNALFSPAPIQRGVNAVTSPAFQVSTAAAEVRFRLWYELETTFLRNRLYDGAVFEVSIADGDWQDILAAGGTFLAGGYDGTIDGCCQNPLAGRLGWSGRSGVNQTPEWIDSVVRLPAAAAGQSVSLRWRVGTDIGTFREGIYIDDLKVIDGFTCDCPAATPNAAPYDFDGDGRTDIAAYSFTDEAGVADIRLIESGSENTVAVSFGSAGDRSTAADFDGDGRTDIAVFRPSTGVWYILRSSDGVVEIRQFGISEDTPAPTDLDGDGRAEIAVFRPSSGVWYAVRSSDSQVAITQFGITGDIPTPGDYDGDGRADIAVFRPSNGFWYVLRSGDGGVTFIQFGQDGDIPVAADLDGDGRTDNAVFRPSNGVWYLLGSQAGFSAVAFGIAEDIPLNADLDGDGRADIAVFRPSTRVWYSIRSSDSHVSITEFGQPGDQPIPAAVR